MLLKMTRFFFEVQDDLKILDAAVSRVRCFALVRLTAPSVVVVANTPGIAGSSRRSSPLVSNRGHAQHQRW